MIEIKDLLSGILNNFLFFSKQLKSKEKVLNSTLMKKITLLMQLTTKQGFIQYLKINLSPN